MRLNLGDIVGNPVLDSLVPETDEIALTTNDFAIKMVVNRFTRGFLNVETSITSGSRVILTTGCVDQALIRQLPGVRNPRVQARLEQREHTSQSEVLGTGCVDCDGRDNWEDSFTQARGCEATLFASTGKKTVT